MKKRTTKKTTSLTQKGLALLLAVIMTLGILPGTVFAVTVQEDIGTPPLPSESQETEGETSAPTAEAPETSAPATETPEGTTVPATETPEGTTVTEEDEESESDESEKVVVENTTTGFNGTIAGSAFAYTLRVAPNSTELDEEIEESLILDKVVSNGGKTASDEQLFDLTLTASSESDISVTADPIDIILVLDTSEQMWKQETVYTKVNFANNDDATTAINAASRQSDEGYFYWDESSGYHRVTGVSADKVSFTGGSSTGADWYTKLYTRSRQRAEGGTDNYLAEMQAAARLFIESCYSPLGERRIAIVTYNTESDVRSSIADSHVAPEDAVDEALVPVTSGGKEYLLNVINGITLSGTAGTAVENMGGDANINNGMNDARKIFQDGHVATGAYGRHEVVPESRQRMVVLLSAGIYGNGKLETLNNYQIAMDAVNISAIIKAPRSITAEYRQTATVNGVSYEFGINPAGYFVDTSNQYGDGVAFKAKYGIDDAEDFRGCGATFYCIGLDMPETVSEFSADKTYVNVDRLANVESQGSRINELFYRLSQHRPDGTHSSYTWYNAWDTTDCIWFDNVQPTVEDDMHWNAHYPDELCRNIDPSLKIFQTKEVTKWFTDINKLETGTKTLLGATGSYFLTTNDADELSSIFKNISQQVGASYAGLKVRDYIADEFVICDDNGYALNVGDTYNGGVVGQDSKGWYIEWSDVEIKPKDVASDGSEISAAVNFEKTITVKAADTYAGGNHVATNKDAYITRSQSSGEVIIGRFPEPHVDIPTDVTVVKEVQGNMGDRAKQFSFFATNVVLSGYDSKDDSAAGETYSNYLYALTSSGNAETQLKHDDKWIFKDIYVGSSMTISEIPEDYELVVQDTDGNPLEITVDTTSGKHTVTVPVVAGMTITFTNTKNVTIDTGISLDSIPYILILVGVIGAGAFLFLRRRRSFED